MDCVPLCEHHHFEHGGYLPIRSWQRIRRWLRQLHGERERVGLLEGYALGGALSDCVRVWLVDNDNLGLGVVDCDFESERVRIAVFCWGDGDECGEPERVRDG